MNKQDKQALIENVTGFFNHHFNINNAKFEILGNYFSWQSNDEGEEMIILEVFSGNVQSLIFDKLLRHFEQYDVEIIDIEDNGAIFI